MGYTKGPARVAINVFRGHSVEMEAFEDERAMVEHFIRDRRLFQGNWDPEALAQWLDEVARLATAAAAQVRADE